MSTLVLVHGAWSDASAWEEVSDRLRARGHAVVAPDLPAHGGDTTSPADVRAARHGTTYDAFGATVD